VLVISNTAVTPAHSLLSSLLSSLPLSLPLLVPLLHSVRDGLQINKYHQWFKGMVNGWVQMATNRCKSRIQQAIQLDQVRDIV